MEIKNTRTCWEPTSKCWIAKSISWMLGLRVKIFTHHIMSIWTKLRCTTQLLILINSRVKRIHRHRTMGGKGRHHKLTKLRFKAVSLCLKRLITPLLGLVPLKVYTKTIRKVLKQHCISKKHLFSKIKRIWNLMLRFNPVVKDKKIKIVLVVMVCISSIGEHLISLRIVTTILCRFSNNKLRTRVVF